MERRGRGGALREPAERLGHTGLELRVDVGEVVRRRVPHLDIGVDTVVLDAETLAVETTGPTSSACAAAFTMSPSDPAYSLVTSTTGPRGARSG